MDYNQFVSAVTRRKLRTSINPNYMKDSYANLRSRGDNYWLHLECLSIQQLASDIINGFLNTPLWNCHIYKPNSVNGRKVLSNLASALRDITDYYAALKDFSLDSVNFQSVCTFRGAQTPIIPVIAEIYYTLSTIEPRFGPVPASKLMHMALPNLFVMWDDSIIDGYHIPKYPSDKPQYLIFLVLMQEYIKHILTTYPKNNTNIGVIVNNINSIAGYQNVPITRLIDIVNLEICGSKAGCPITRCKICSNNTNLKLSNISSYLKTNYLIDPSFGYLK